MRENVYRFILALLVALVMVLVVSEIVRGNPKEISLDVMPKIIICLPHQKPSIRVRMTINPHPDNRWRSLAIVSEGESSVRTDQVEGDKDALVFTTFHNVSCATNLVTACVYRITDGKSKRFCVESEVKLPEGG